MKAVTRQFALFKQTILSDTRSPGLQLFRFIFAVAIAVIVYICQAQFNQFMKIDGLLLFEILSMVNICFCYLAAFCLFLPIIREEKEENTLGLILMTGISPFAYLFGKIGSRMTMLGIILMLQIPFTFLCITMGGVSYSSILLVFLLIFLLVFQLATLSVMASLICTNYFTGAFIVSGLYLSVCFTFFWVFKDSKPDIILPFQAVSELLSPVGGSSSVLIYYMLWMFVSALLFFWMSSVLFNKLIEPKSELEVPAKLKGKSASTQKSEAFKGNFFTSILPRLKSKRFSHRAISFKDFRFTHFGTGLMIFQFLFLSFFIIVNSEVLYEGYYAGSGGLNEFSNNIFDSTSFLLLFLVMFAGNRMLAVEIKGNTLNCLLMLPQTHRKLYWQKAWGVFRLLLPTIIIFTVLLVTYLYTIPKEDPDYFGYIDGLENYQIYGKLLTLTFIICSFFISSCASVMIKKYSFFISFGAITAYFFGYVFISTFLGLYISGTFWIMLGTSSLISFTCYKLTLFKLKKGL